MWRVRDPWNLAGPSQHTIYRPVRKHRAWSVHLEHAKEHGLQPSPELLAKVKSHIENE